jgi:hypothetical protein
MQLCPIWQMQPVHASCILVRRLASNVHSAPLCIDNVDRCTLSGEPEERVGGSKLFRIRHPAEHVGAQAAILSCSFIAYWPIECQFEDGIEVLKK